MDKIKLCVPTLNRYDLCLKLLESAEANTIKPEEYVIVDNGGKFKEYFEQSNIKRLIKNIRIFTPKRNLGVASSWNWFLQELPGNLLISNDDITFSQIVIEKFLKVRQEEQDSNVVIYTTGKGSYELFMTDKSILFTVGKFDENFYPAYYEDNDYKYRMKLLGLKDREVFPAGHKYFFHEVSATMKLINPIEHEINFNINKKYYSKKWGGDPLHETYLTPFSIGEFIK